MYVCACVYESMVRAKRESHSYGIKAACCHTQPKSLGAETPTSVKTELCEHPTFAQHPHPRAPKAPQLLVNDP